MQQLLGDSAGPEPDSSFLRELFLQCLPDSVRMGLASTGNAISLEALAQMADKIVEVATPTISAINAPIFHRKWTSYGRKLHTSERLSPPLTHHRVAPDPPSQEDARPAHTQPILLLPLVGIIDSLGKKLASATHLVSIREMSRPVASGDKRYWPTIKSPLHY